VIGANDLTALVPAARAATDLGAAVRDLRGSGAQVVVAPAPDLSVVPHVPAALREGVRAGSLALREAQARATTAAGGTVADDAAGSAAAFGADPRLFSRDRFHPSSAGYAVIAAALVPAVLAAAGEVEAQRRSA
jgi:lysophospholipase L1-like esterase